MIQQIHLEPWPNPEVPTGKKITMPGLGVDIKQVMQQYARQAPEERAKAFYEEKGMVVPDFDRMSKIERLEALGNYRKQVKSINDDLNKKADKARVDQKEAILQKSVNQKVEDELKKRTSSSDK